LNTNTALYQVNNKPVSVKDDHLSRLHVTMKLKRPTRTFKRDEQPLSSYLDLHWGQSPCPSCHQNGGALLPTPFHPYLYQLKSADFEKINRNQLTIGGLFSVACR